MADLTLIRSDGKLVIDCRLSDPVAVSRAIVEIDAETRLKDREVPDQIVNRERLYKLSGTIPKDGTARWRCRGRKDIIFTFKNGAIKTLGLED